MLPRIPESIASATSPLAVGGTPYTWQEDFIAQ